jgi:hypothetical protein
VYPALFEAGDNRPPQIPSLGEFEQRMLAASPAAATANINSDDAPTIQQQQQFARQTAFGNSPPPSTVTLQSVFNKLLCVINNGKCAEEQNGGYKVRRHS